jgi:hypothetical protein
MASRAWRRRSDSAGAARWVLSLLVSLGGCYQGIPSGRDVADDGDEGGQGSRSQPEVDDGPQLPAQPLHRLNRLEYDNTVRDLLGTTLRPAAGFNPDPVANGFDNMADQLGISPALFHGYGASAREVIDDALDDKPLYSLHRAAAELGIAGGYPVGDLWALSGHPIVVEIDVPPGLDTELVFSAGASVVGSAEQPAVSVTVDDVGVTSFVVGGSAADLQVYVQPLAVEPGPHTIRITPTNFINEAAANISNNVIVSSVEVRSLQMGEGPGRGLVYVCDPVGVEGDACFEEIIETFAFRAWRRPPAHDEVERLFELFTEVRETGESPEDALKLVMRAIMTSPKFLYRLRTTSDADSDEWLDDFVLASRLSYFLWSTMPDDRLFAAAREGRLSTPEGLSETVAWMLDDDKARGLSDGFAEQWLSTRHLDVASPNPVVYPEFDESLREAMVQESKLFFEDFLHNGLPVTALIEPPFAYRNDRLAEHYGMPEPGTHELTRMDVAPEERRGLLSLGAWLIAQSESDHSSPILRGVWVSDRILCTPVPPPPPGLVIDPLEVGGEDSVREQLERHRTDPTCATCHQLLDVLGMGFEEFDGIGRQILDPELDTMGELPDGRTFEGAAEFSAMFGDSEAFVGCVAQKLYTYALGRTYGGPDVPYMQDIVAAATAGQYGMRELIDAIVQAPTFRSPGSFEEGE